MAGWRWLDKLAMPRSVKSLFLAGLLLAPASAMASDDGDPLQCGAERLALEPDYPARIFDHFLASARNKAVSFLTNPEVAEPLLRVAEFCTASITQDETEIALIVLGIVGEQLIAEGRERFRDLGLGHEELDALFVPAFKEMPLDTLDLIKFRPPKALRKPAFALRDLMVEESGRSEREINDLLIPYTSGLVGREAALRVLENAPQD
jgi:hypothetical protein